MSIGARYKAFHEQAQIKLLRQLAGLDLGSAEADVRKEYETAEAASALWELEVEDERNGGKLRR